MSVGSPTAGTWSSSQWRPDNEFETDTQHPHPIGVLLETLDANRLLDASGRNPDRHVVASGRELLDHRVVEPEILR